MDEITVIPASHEDWAGLVRRAAEPDGHEARVTLEVHQRLLAVEARLPWVGTAADVAPQVVSATTTDDLSPVEPAPQYLQGVTVEELMQSLPPNFRDAQACEWAAARAAYLQHGHASPAPDGVTVEELACIMREMPDTPVDAPPWYEYEAAWLLAHPRIGPLLRGEGAPVPVAVQSLQLLPTQWALLAFVVRNYNDEGKRIAEAWQSSEMKELSQIINDYAHAEVARQQGGQADG